jgi:outer membrane protein
MSVVLIRSDFWKKLIALVCVLSFTAMAQQGNTTLSVLPQAQSGTSATPAPTQQSAAPNAVNAPEPRPLPKISGIDYSKPASFFPNPFARYMPREVPPPAFTNAPKLEQLIQNGKLVLSLDDAIAIAVSDNLDIAVARYNLPIADTDILRTKSGGAPLGVNAGVVSNTPGGGEG